MDKYEYTIKTEQIKKLVSEHNYRDALEIVDEIDWRRVRNVSMLTMAADVYKRNQRFEDCRDVLIMAYDRAPIGRRILKKLTEVAIIMRDFEEAEEYYEEFVKIAPTDLSRYTLKYKIEKGKGADLGRLIHILEELKSQEYLEEWAYELALLYKKAGFIEKCVAECDDIILWFSQGDYVVKAMELKKQFAPLTADQQEKYDNRFKQYEIKGNLFSEEKEPGEQEETEKKEAAEVDKDTEKTENTVNAEKTEETVAAENLFKDTVEIPKLDIEFINKVMENSKVPPVITPPVIDERPVLEETEKKQEVTENLEEIQKEQAVEDVKEEKRNDEEEALIEEETEPMKLEASVEEEREEEALVLTEETSEKDIAAEAIEEEGEAKEQPAGSVSQDTLNSMEANLLKQALMSEMEGQIIKQADMSMEERELAPDVSELTAAQKEILAPYLEEDGMEKQFIKLFHNIEKYKNKSGTSRFGNILIVGDDVDVKMKQLAMDVIKVIAKQAKKKSGRIAKVNADIINRKGIARSIEKIKGTVLVIEDAGHITKDRMKELISVMDGPTEEMLVILECERMSAKGLILDVPEIKSKFQCVIKMPFDRLREPIKWAVNYARDNDYVIDEGGIEALRKKIVKQFGDKNPEKDDICLMVEEAIDHSETKNIKNLFDIVFSKKYEEDELTVLKDADFK